MLTRRRRVLRSVPMPAYLGRFITRPRGNPVRRQRICDDDVVPNVQSDVPRVPFAVLSAYWERQTAAGAYTPESLVHDRFQVAPVIRSRTVTGG